MVGVYRILLRVDGEAILKFNILFLASNKDSICKLLKDILYQQQNIEKRKKETK